MSIRRFACRAFWTCFCLLALAGSAAYGDRGEDWPQFRGPERRGATAEAAGEGWPGGPPKEAWRQGVGGGFSSVTVAGERLYTVELEGEEEVVTCRSAADGSLVWKQAIGPTAGEAFPEGGPRASVTVAGETLYTASSGGRVVALDAADGGLVWSRELSEDGPIPRFGYSVSPLVDGDLVLVEAGKPGEEPGVLALDRATGELVWGALEGPAGYSSPVAVEILGQRQYLFFRRARAEVVSLSTGGEVLWRHPTQGLAIIVTPLFLPPNRVFVATSDDGFGGLMLEVSRTEEGYAVREVWSERLMRNHFNASVEVGGYLYGFDNSTFRCLDAATGERRWAKRGLGKGSLIASGELLFVLSDAGVLVVVEATPAAYRELGRVQAMRGRSWTEPSLARGRLYLRDFDELVSYQLEAGEPAGQPAPAPAGAPGEATPAPATEELTAASVVGRYLEARGGAERWRRHRTLRATGTYAAFSQTSPFELLRMRGDQYRLEFQMLGGTSIRARDAEGTWGQHPLLKPQAGRITEGPYRAQFERESRFEPLLLDYQQKGITVTLEGQGEINGQPTVDLRLELPGGAMETWHLDPASFLEVAVDSQVIDMTQLPEPMRQRAFYDDFREVDGLVLPFRVDLEFGARLETMEIETLTVDEPIAAERFMPPPAPEAEAGEAADGSADAG